MWYMIAKPCRVSVLRIGVCDPGGAEWSCRRCTGPALGSVSISLISHEHLTLAVASHGAPRGARASGCSVLPWAYKQGPPFCLNHL